ncbi:uncharacterized protein TNCV_3369781 [Trichonephila clavipes]|uniref:Uncharacterized protein n=1 Tax=Trichonephila clavipes TaxID=2585209 RepID=A0A8X6R791_TRICX|nr:uncharacterized protein TNCV_3369781 [Trichonephila clavipes]
MARRKGLSPDFDEDIRLNESDCEESKEKNIIDYIPVNPDRYIATDGTEGIPHNSNVPGRFATRNVLQQSSGPTSFEKTMSTRGVATAVSKIRAKNVHE